VGYLRGPRLGAWTYNLVHTEALPVREVGMMHCYAGDLDLARRYRDLGFLISVPGPVTYANNTRGRGVAAEVPLNRLLVGPKERPIARRSSVLFGSTKPHGRR